MMGQAKILTPSQANSVLIVRGVDRDWENAKSARDRAGLFVTGATVPAIRNLVNWKCANVKLALDGAC